MEVWIRESERKDIVEDLIVKHGSMIGTPGQGVDEQKEHCEEVVNYILDEIGIGILEDEPIETEKEGV